MNLVLRTPVRVVLCLLLWADSGFADLVVGSGITRIGAVVGDGVIIKGEETFTSDDFGAYFFTSIFSLGSGPKHFTVEVFIRGQSDPFVAHDMEVTNTTPDPVDLMLSTIIDIGAVTDLSPMLSTLGVTYSDNDLSGSINATVSHKAFPQTEFLGGFLAQSITTPITSAGTTNTTLGPENITPPGFPPPPFTKLNTILEVTNLLPGDSIMVSGRTDLQAIPEPSSLALVLVFGAGCVTFHRLQGRAAAAVRHVAHSSGPQNSS